LRISSTVSGQSRDSPRQAAARLHAFVEEQVDAPGVVAAVTHGGVTADLLRTLVGNDAVPADVVHYGVPSSPSWTD